MIFRTEISVPPQEQGINYHTPVVMMGSCFTDQVGRILKQYLFDVTINPFGVIYNPYSVRKNIDALLHKEAYLEEDLSFHRELWFSFDHYTRFSGTDKSATLAHINREFKKAKEKLQSARYLIITFGTAFVYRYKKTGQVVCNCHKIPAGEFERTMLSPRQVVQAYTSLLDELEQQIPGLNIIFTISPVRHVKDSLPGNQRSKAVLLLAIEELLEHYPDRTCYFPAYEIMMDDLRDYRYYASDLVHPNDQAVAYIWEKFSGSMITTESLDIMHELEPLIRSLRHRPLHTDTMAYRNFASDTSAKAKKLKNKFPFLCWEQLELK